MKRWLLRFALLLTALVVSFGVAEWAVRIAAPPSLEPAILQPEAGAAFFGAGMLESIERGGVRYIGRPGASVEVFGVEYQHNRLGLRGPEVAPTTAGKSEAVRILLVGDSNAYGWGVKEPDSLRAQLEKILNEREQERPNDRRYEVVAAAFPGYNTADQFAVLKRVWPDVRPHLVLAAWFANDLERLGFHVDADHALFCDPLPLPDRLKPTLWRSHLYRLLSLGQLGRIQEQGTLQPTHEAPRSYSEQYLLEMARFSKANGAKFAALDIPVLEPTGATQRMRRDGYPFERSSKWFREVTSAAGIPAIELLDAIENEPTALLWASMERNDHHPNAKAHRLFAEAISRFIEDQGLLDDD